MPKIWLSTLEKLPNKLGVDRQIFREKFMRFFNENDDDQDIQIEITLHEKNWLDFLCQNITYPACVLCNKPICGETKEICCCQDINRYQEEYIFLLKEVHKAESAFKKLKASPFRQSRNAFGFAGSIFGGINLFLNNIVSLGMAVTCPLLIVPPLLLGGFVYLRGRREEHQINSDLEADLIDRKISLLSNHRKSVQRRYENNLICPTPKFLQETLITKLKPPKEKRGLFGNPTSHFIVGSLTTMALACAVVKWGFIGTLIAGGPLTWAISAGLSIVVGAYFAYKRYQHLSSKINFEKQMAYLAEKEAEINRLKEGELSPSYHRQKSAELRFSPSRHVTTNDLLKEEKNFSCLFNQRRHSLPNLRFYTPAVKNHCSDRLAIGDLEPSKIQSYEIRYKL